MHAFLPCLLSAVLVAPQEIELPLKVICTVPAYGELASTIGGDLVETIVICRPTQDLHQVVATPSLMGRAADADLCLHSGLDTEPWLDGLLRGSGNVALLPGGPRSVDLSQGITLKEVPNIVSRTQGDIHAYGNPHMWSDPLNVRVMAEHVRDALVELVPSRRAEIEARHDAFHDQLTAALVRWLTQYQHLRGVEVVTYHKSWPYFLDRFGLVLAGTIEPKPRVAPTAGHLEELVATMKAQDVRVVIREPFQHPDATDFIADATGATVLELSTHPGFPEGVDGIIEHFEHNLAAIDGALGGR